MDPDPLSVTQNSNGSGSRREIPYGSTGSGTLLQRLPNYQKPAIPFPSYLHVGAMAGRVGENITLGLSVESPVDEDGAVVQHGGVTETRQITRKVARDCIFCTRK
jgi:hypothetical protein